MFICILNLNVRRTRGSTRYWVDDSSNAVPTITSLFISSGTTARRGRFLLHDSPLMMTRRRDHHLLRLSNPRRSHHRCGLLERKTPGTSRIPYAEKLVAHHKLVLVEHFRELYGVSATTRKTCDAEKVKSATHVLSGAPDDINAGGNSFWSRSWKKSVKK